MNNINNDIISSDVNNGCLIQVTSSCVGTKLSPPSILRRGFRYKRRRSKSSDDPNNSSDFILPDEHPVSKQHMVSAAKTWNKNWHWILNIPTSTSGKEVSETETDQTLLDQMFLWYIIVGSSFWSNFVTPSHPDT
jgi:hypothetical protein